MDDKDEEMDLAGLTHEELIARLQEASISRKPKGSAPISENETSHSDSEEEESTPADISSDGSGDSSGSTSGFSVEQSNKSQNGTDSG